MFYKPELVEKHKALLVDGLSSTNSYVALVHKSRVPVLLQFKPFIERVDQNVLSIGGKLSAFFDANKSDKIEGLGYDEREQKLAKAFAGLQARKRSYKRVGTLIGLSTLAGVNQLRAYRAAFKDSGVVAKLLTFIESNYGVEIENKRKVKEALEDMYLHQIETNHLFADVKVEAKAIPKTLLGRSTPVVEGMDFRPQSVQLVSKIRPKKAA